MYSIAALPDTNRDPRVQKELYEVDVEGEKLIQRETEMLEQSKKDLECWLIQNKEHFPEVTDAHQ